MIIHQITGFTNSGKTTIMTELIAYLSDLGYRVCTIKHHGHTDSLKPEYEPKDSMKHRNAGAKASLVYSDQNELQLIADQTPEKLTLEQLISLYSVFHFDILLIEGYKHAGYPKTFVMRDQDRKTGLSDFKHVKATISQGPAEQPGTTPVFQRDRLDEYFEWFLKSIVKEGSS
ncbi:molybdopterin-guanine dinucleotide biosynthesis protein B [Salisediminibacterium selenitireducens]|uniref:Molybdopterin-guanine dinucleotide biosynthesis protein B n=1 Tax=Bacillus selenitireducens (strain ATCC 700615 / DSM 15326 / MLS10) TaxID=439292 RepID=D6XTA2_BACIE|nr:molybdopterin-guanine dinucleotide biosynthesis protein B [Salisediminibacterium selenitireducens]ADH99038.1 molybdopterin-guanine dinucleotide biosynthesis protein B [[Bacillus] selenitireducens MLS10]